MRVITLPALDKQVSLRAYVAAIRLAKANPGAEFRSGLSSWWPTSGADVMRQFREGMHERINARTPYIKRGRAI